MAFDMLMNGVGNAFAVESWGTHFLLQKDDYLLGVDCPDSYRRALRENGFENADGLPLDVDSLDGLVITHLHGDHVNGLEMLLAYRRYIVGEPLDLYMHPQAADHLWDRRLEVSLGQSWNGERHESLYPEDYYELHPIPWETPVQIGPFEVETRETIHHITTMAMRVSDGDASLGYSCDTAFDPDLIDWLAEADAILHETSLGPGHTPLQALEGLDPKIKQRMRLAHLPDELLDLADDTDLDFAEEGAIYRVAGSP